MLNRFATFLFLSATAFTSACMSSDPVGDEPGDPPPAGPASSATDRISVQYPWGIERVPYEIVDGFVIVGGDMIVGRAEDLGRRSTTRVGGRWPSGQVQFAFDGSVPAADRTAARDAAALLESETPLDFVEILNPCSYPDNACAEDYILIRNWSNSFGQSATPGGAGQVGYLGGQQIINEPSGFSQSGFLHELMHAIGMYHEQERYDRDSYVQFRPECTLDDKEGNFNKRSDPAVDFGTYDFASIMHYRSSSFVVPAAEQAAAPCNGHWPLERIAGVCPVGACTDKDSNGWREFVEGASALSVNDVDAVWAMYAPALAAHEAGDQLGSVIAVGDFDGDGRMDLASGIPGEDTVNNTISNAGAVLVMKGTEDGFQPWRLITQSSIGAAEEAGDQLGSALAAGDFDGDGIDDLAIGAPGESVGATAAAGAVYLMRGSSTGLLYWKTLTEASVGAAIESSDRFGAALAVGDFNGDLEADLAIGATGKRHGDGIAAGHVYVLKGTGTSTGPVAWDSVSQASLSVAPNVAPGGILPPPLPLGTHQASDLFGSALASGRIDDDSKDDLVVAASCDHELATCAGGVYLYRGSSTGMRGWMRLGQSTGADAYDRYGWSVATGDVDMDGDDDILVGAPYDDVSGVTNVGQVYWSRPQGHVITGVLTWTQANSDFGTNDEFGSSIAIGQTGAFDRIAIGARNESWGAGEAAGVVFMFKSSDSGTPSFSEILRAAPASSEVAADLFGHAVAVYTEGGRDFLAVGNPGEDSSAGAVQTFAALPQGSPFAQSQLLRQDTKGTRAP